MIAHHPRARSGITLTEILISILIMGVGLISLATLFPIGLVRLRDAARQSRSALLAESVVGDMGSKNLLDRSTFAETYYGTPGVGNGYNPFVTDPNGANTLSANALTGGLPFCYDPLWRSVTGYLPPITNPNFVLPAVTYTPNPNGYPFRFGTGYYLRPDPDGNQASAYGLQRISNFVPFVPPTANSLGTSAWPLTYIFGASGFPTLKDSAESTFVSPEDMVMQNNEAGQSILLNPDPSGKPTSTASGVVPMFFQNLLPSGAPGPPETRLDYHYSWLFTGRQIDVTNATIFGGDVVVMENRPFGAESVPGSTIPEASGETVVEAVFGPGSIAAGGPSLFYAPAASRTVLLRWNASQQPDPEIKVGSWIADVTYELNASTSNTRQASATPTGTVQPMQRCHWYQITKKTEVINEYDPQSAPYQNGYRRMTVQINTPLKAQTLLTTGGNPVHVNAALIMPSVVNVFSKTFYVR